jgi:hypothetical protein
MPCRCVQIGSDCYKIDELLTEAHTMELDTKKSHSLNIGDQFLTNHLHVDTNHPYFVTLCILNVIPP